MMQDWAMSKWHPVATKMDWSSSGTREIAPGVQIFHTATAKYPDFKGFDVTLQLRLSEAFRVEVEVLTVVRVDGGSAVTGEAIRTLPIQSLVRDAIRFDLEDNFLENAYGDEETVAFGMLLQAEATSLRKSGPSATTLEWVGRIYKVAEVLDEPPTIAIQNTFEISRSTAGSWIGRARSAGLLPKPRNTNA